MISLIIFLPLFSSICVGLWGYKLGTKGTVIITIFCLSFTTLFSVYFMTVFSKTLSPFYISLGEWVSVGNFSSQWAIAVDSLTITMCVLVSLISSLVYLYVRLDKLDNLFY